jgi:uncharacterized protein (DUF1697 family)
MKSVALLRGINVGGKNLLPMKELAAIFEKAGAREVETYIQSGNVVFEGGADLASKVSKAIGKKFGFEAPIVVRTAAEMAAIVKAAPFDPAVMHVGFLADEPDPAAAKALDPNRSPGDRFVVRGREVYLCLPNAVAKTKLTNAWFDMRLETVCTIRNWKTVTEMARLAASYK